MSVVVRLVDVDVDPDDGTRTDLETLDQYEVSEGVLRFAATGGHMEAVAASERVRTAKGWARVVVTVRVEQDAMVVAR